MRDVGELFHVSFRQLVYKEQSGIRIYRIGKWPTFIARAITVTLVSAGARRISFLTYTRIQRIILPTSPEALVSYRGLS